MDTVNYAEKWIDKYDNQKSVINFVAGDYNSLRDVIRRYVTLYNPENYNDWAESSECGLFVNGLSYLGSTIHYRVDLNAHDIFPSTTERRQSLLNFVKMLSYSAKRNIAANGLVKITSVSTTQNIQDTTGNNLKDITINWNDTANKNWLEQFLTIINSALVSNNPFGKPLKKDSSNGITSQLYEFNSITNQKTVFPFTANINGSSQQFEIVNSDIDLVSSSVYERDPVPESAFHILYRNDGTGNSSNNTGFFFFWKQGSLQSTIREFSDKIENNSVEITANNINEYDVWVQQIDGESGLLKENWTKIDADEYLVYNTTDNKERNIFKVETRENDQIIVRFSDGRFGNIPVGIFRIWYRVSQGNANLYIKNNDIKNVSIKIPYKSNNTNDNNVYYLTCNFSLVDVSHIRQSVVQESLENIRERSSQVYSTQNRMVNGSDYNKYPLSFGQQIKILNSILRTYSGNSRYINFNDPTGNYQDLNVISDDGYIYKDDGVYTSEILLSDYSTPEQIITNNIEPLLDNLSFTNFLYDNFPVSELRYMKTKNSTPEKMMWIEEYSSGEDSSYGKFVLETDSSEIVPYTYISKYINTGSMIKFRNMDNDNEVWCKIINIVTDVNSTNIEYEILINEALDINYNWYIDEYYRPFSTSFDIDTKNNILNYLKEFSSFGIRYNYEKSYWDIVPYKSLSNDDKFIYNSNPDYSIGSVTDWLIKCEYNISGGWKFVIRYTDYIFSSVNNVSFFFNTNEKNNNNTFVTSDYIKVFKKQENIETNYDRDFYWKPCNVIRYSDGYIDPKRFKVYGYDDDKDSSVDNPIQFSLMTTDSNLFFRKDENDYLTFMDGIKEVDTLWEITRKTGTFYSRISGTIYPSGIALPKNIVVKHNVSLSNGSILRASETNPITFRKDRVYPYDIVDEGFDENGNKIDSELVYWNTSSLEMIRYKENEDYIVKKGVKNLSFLWKHYASSSYLIDPSTTNIIDMFVMTLQYYNDVQTWIKNGKKDVFPKLPTSSELKSIFNELETKAMISDTIIWHPVKYRLLFGNYADNEFKASFRVIKNQYTNMSDNEIKQQIITAIDEFFANMKVGEKFFYTNLSTYIENKLNGNIGTVVIVPEYNNEKFGNLFEIYCESDEILLSSATVDNIQIINKITDFSIKIGQ